MGSSIYKNRGEVTYSFDSESLRTDLGCRNGSKIQNSNIKEDCVNVTNTTTDPQYPGNFRGPYPTYLHLSDRSLHKGHTQILGWNLTETHYRFSSCLQMSVNCCVRKEGVLDT